MDTPLNVKLLLPPRQSRGDSQNGLAAFRYRLGEAKVWSVVRIPSVEDEISPGLCRENYHRRILIFFSPGTMAFQEHN